MRQIITPLRVIGAVSITAAAAALWWWHSVRHIESTDDAYVEADIVPISARLSGYVRTVDVADHQSVAAGAQLLTIDPVDYRVAVERAQAMVEARRASVARVDRELTLQEALIEAGAAQIGHAEAEERRAQLDLQRSTRLIAQSVVPAQLHERAAAEAEQASAQRIAAEATYQAERRRLHALTAERREAIAAIEEAEAALRLAQWDLEHTVIRAAVSGVVGNRAVHAGQYVRPGTRLLMLVPLARSYVIANFKETQLGKLRRGQPVEVTVDAYPGVSLQGRVKSLAPASGAEFALLPPENATGNFRKIVQRVPVRIDLAPAPDGIELRPGLSVIVRVDTRETRHRAVS